MSEFDDDHDRQGRRDEPKAARLPQAGRRIRQL